MPHKNVDERKEYQRRYRAKHADKLLADSRIRSARYYDEHRDAVLKRCAQYNQHNKEQCRMRAKKYYDEHRNLYKKLNHDYNLEHPECSINKRVRRKTLIGEVKLTKADWLAIMVEWKWSCAYCGTSLTNITRSIDHVVSLICGGSHSRWNLVAACRTCNSSKHDSLPHKWRNCPALPSLINTKLWVMTLINIPLSTVLFGGGNQW